MAKKSFVSIINRNLELSIDMWNNHINYQILHTYRKIDENM
jgi:hypothetical protein